MSSRGGVGGDGWSWSVTVFLDKLKSSELNLKREVIILYGLCFLTDPKRWRSSVETLHTPHSLSTEGRCSANLHQIVFWLGKREVCNEKFWQPYLCVCSWALGWGPAAGYSTVVYWELPSVCAVPPGTCVPCCWKGACLSLFFYVLIFSVSLHSPDMNPQILPYVVELCWESVSAMNPWPKSYYFLNSSETFLNMWKCQHLILLLMPLLHSR